MTTSKIPNDEGMLEYESVLNLSCESFDFRHSSFTPVPLPLP